MNKPIETAHPVIVSERVFVTSNGPLSFCLAESDTLNTAMACNKHSETIIPVSWLSGEGMTSRHFVGGRSHCDMGSNASV